ncbi:MAG: hypothetical protein QF535_08445 [Anaerolineales bacterium]|nr:hypothetical protein [Anaerolineales bacterium]
MATFNFSVLSFIQAATVYTSASPDIGSAPEFVQPAKFPVNTFYQVAVAVPTFSAGLLQGAPKRLTLRSTK